MAEWHSTRNGSVLVDEDGKIVGETRHNLANGEHINVATGERYISERHARQAAEKSTATKEHS